MVIKKWWIEPYTDFEGASGIVVVCETNEGKKLTYGAMFSTTTEALSHGAFMYGTEPDYVLSAKTVGLMEDGQYTDLNKVRSPLREETTRWATHLMTVDPECSVFILAGKWSKP